MKDTDQKISFDRGVPATESFSVKKIGAVAKKVMDKYGNSLLQYGDARGFSPLRDKLADWHEGSVRGDILIGNGSLQILDMIANLYIEPGDTVLVERPSYDRAITIFNRAGAEVQGVKLENDGPNLDKLETLLETHHPELLYTIPDFQNPTGVCASARKREEVAELTAEQGTLVVEDSPYRKLRYRGAEKPTLRSFNPEGVVQMSSFSKLIGPGMRVGWVVGNSETIDDLAVYAEDTYITPSLLSQGMINHLIEEGWLEENIKELIALYKPRLEATLVSLQEYFPEAGWVQAQGGFFVGLWLPDSSLASKFYDRAEKENLILSTSEGFFPDCKAEGFVRLPFPALSPDLIEEGIRRIGRVWRDL
ncbi:PLP-dependent aminotransferase family protein [Candidatus Bipolaricaulota bacterium]|nr:PLP-dependent aminotransferase family protein [Candidatus Bipolaricaulota bacterium]